jgi:DNA (cytosine-5)-methyltransferase 1
MEEQLRLPHPVIRSNNLDTCRGARVRLSPKLRSEEGEAAWQKAVSAPDAMVAVDLFCGAGGLSYGFQEAGFVTALGIDSDADACETHAANLLSSTLCQDIRTIKHPQALVEELGIPRVDVVIGGPPCQGFSLVGRGKVRSLSKEMRDKIYSQNYLYREFVRFVQSLRPLFFVMENVPHLSSFADGIIAEAIAQDFDALGYNIYHELLEAAHYGVPQTRRRLFIIGTRIGWVYRKPRVTHGHTRRVRTLADAIADLPPVQAPALVEESPYFPYSPPDVHVSGEYAMFMRSSLPPDYQGIIFDHIVRPIREDDAVIFRSMKPGNRYRDVDPRYRRYALKQAQRDGRYYFADRYYKLPWDQPCVTITAHMAKDGYRYIHPDSEQPCRPCTASGCESAPCRVAA